MMSEDRTQSPSERRRQEARAMGLVARSPELTAAVGLLAAVAALGTWGGALASAFGDLIRASFEIAATIAEPPDVIVSSIRAAAWRVASPLAAILASILVAMTVAHQAQVGGGWTPSLIAPDLGRLGGLGGGAGLATRAGRGLWGLAKTGAVVALAVWSIRSGLLGFARLSDLRPAALAVALSASLRGVLFLLAIAALVLGLIDFVLQHQRVEAMLRVSPEEQREDQKAIDGDPAVRARRHRMARSWRSDPKEALAGAVLVVGGPAGMVVVLSGDGPPGRVTVRASGRGGSGSNLKRAAVKAGLPVAELPAVAVHFSSPAARGKPLTPELTAALASVWPRKKPDPA